MTATPTLEARLAELLPQCTWATDCASFAQKTGRTDITPCRPCRDRAAILALIREREREVRRETIEAAALVCRHYHESEADEHPNDDERYGAICCEELILKLGGMNNAP